MKNKHIEILEEISNEEEDLFKSTYKDNINDEKIN